MKTTRVLAVFLAVSILPGASPAPACSLRMPLWQMFRAADVIAVAQVEGLVPKALSAGQLDEILETDVAALKLLDTWKGSAPPRILVDFSGALSTGGRKVQVGDRLLVFLESGDSQVRRSREAEAFSDPLLAEQVPPAELAELRAMTARWEESRAGRWFFADQGDGILEADEKAAATLKDLIPRAAQFQELDKIDGGELVGWLVDAAGVAAFRRRAIDDLSAIAGTVRFADPEPDDGDEQGEPETPAPSAVRLTEGQLRKLADSFVAEPFGDGSLPGLMGLLRDLHDETLDRAVVSVIEAGVYASRVPSWVPEAIRELVVSRGWRDWGSELWQRYAAEGTLKDHWPAIAADLQLPAVAPAGILLEDTGPDPD